VSGFRDNLESALIDAQIEATSNDEIPKLIAYLSDHLVATAMAQAIGLEYDDVEAVFHVSEKLQEWLLIEVAKASS